MRVLREGLEHERLRLLREMLPTMASAPMTPRPPEPPRARKPIETMLGRQGDPVKCSRWMHWWALPYKKGAKCLCGAQTYQGKAKR